MPLPQADQPDGSHVWIPAIVDNMARLASPNEVACTWRRLDKATSRQLAAFKDVCLSFASPAHEFKRRWGSPDAYRGLTREKRKKLICLTAASGSLENLRVALDNAGLVPGGEVLEAAAGVGQLEACKLLRERYDCPWAGALAAAARGGHRHVCEWALASGCPLTADGVFTAARGGHVGLMRWMLERLWAGNGAADVGSLLVAGAEGLDLAAFQMLYQQQLSWEWDQPQQQRVGGGKEREQPPPPPELKQKLRAQVLAAAAASLTPDWQAKVEWLEELGYPLNTGTACEQAAERGPGGDAVGRLRWLHARGYPLAQGVANASVRVGDLAALRFLMEQAGVVPGDWATWNATEGGHLAVLQYLHGRTNLIHSPMLGLIAARRGHLPLVAWLESLGRTVIIRYPNRTVTRVSPNDTPELLDAAAASGSVELMVWLLERGWVWGDRTLNHAAESGCKESLEWLVERGCPWPVDGGPYVEAARYGDLAMARCLHRLGCPWGEGRQLLARCIRVQAPVPSLRLLLELGCPEQDWGEVAAAVEAMQPGEHRTAALGWLGEERLP